MSEPAWVLELINDSSHGSTLPFVAVARGEGREFIRYRATQKRAEDAIDFLRQHTTLDESYVVELGIK